MTINTQVPYVRPRSVRRPYNVGFVCTLISYLINPLCILSIIGIVGGSLAMVRSRDLIEDGHTEVRAEGGGVLTAAIISTVVTILIAIRIFVWATNPYA